MLKKIFVCIISALSLSVTSLINRPQEENIAMNDFKRQAQPVKYRQNQVVNHNEDSHESLDDNLSFDEFDESNLQKDSIGVNHVQARTVDATKDKYENNDSIAAATLISPTYDGTYAPTSYSISLDATLHRNELLWGLIKQEVDVDYYQFRVFGKADLNIELTNIPSGCDYDLELFEHNNSRYAEEEAVTSIATSSRVTNCDEKITKFIFPGVYYIKVYSYADTFNAQQNYHLSLDVN